MIRAGFLSVSLFLAVSCAGLPVITPVPASTCPVMAPEGDWQFVHSIETDLSGGGKSVLLGVTSVYARSQKIRCVIMTLEGLVLFDAESGARLKVYRAVPPFDAGSFAEGMMADVRLIFRPPGGERIASGLTKGGAAVCRYRQPDGRIVDTLALSDGTRKALRYTARGVPDRTVTAVGPGLKRLELVATGPRPYRLRMKLITADPIDPERTGP